MKKIASRKEKRSTFEDDRDRSTKNTINYESVERTANNNLWDSLRLLIGFFDLYFAQPPRFSSCFNIFDTSTFTQFFIRAVCKIRISRQCNFIFFIFHSQIAFCGVLTKIFSLNHLRIFVWITGEIVNYFLGLLLQSKIKQRKINVKKFHKLFFLL